MSKNTDIEQIIQLWYEAKRTQNNLDKQINQYRNYIEKYMDTNGLDKMNLNNIVLKKINS